MHRAGDPTRVYYALVAGSAFLFNLSFAVNLVYMVTVAHLDAFEMVMVGTVLELACFVLEIPTGAIADLVSRRTSILIGFGLIGVGLLSQGLVTSFGALLLVQVIWGAGSTCTSGAVEAWIADELEGAGATSGAVRRDLSHVLSRGVQWSLGASIVGIAVAGAAALLSVRVPMVASGVGFLALTVVLAVWMPERYFRRPEYTGGHLAQLLSTVRAGFALTRRRRVVASVIAVALFIGLSSEAFDRLWQLRLLTRFGPAIPAWQSHPATWFAGIELVGAAIALVSSLLVARRLSGTGPDGDPRRVLAGLLAVNVVAVAVVGLSGVLGLSLAALWLKSAATALFDPIKAAWLNWHVDSSVRATVLSFESQVNAIGQVAGGPPLGLLGRRTSVGVALVAAALLLTPAVAVVLRTRTADQA